MRQVLRVVATRLALSVITLFVVSIVIFSAVTLLPGDFAKAILGQSATPENVAAFQRELGLDRPPVLRYLDWAGHVLVGDLGESFASGAGYRRTVAEVIEPRLMNTLFLASMTAIIAVPLSLALGIGAALWRGSWFDRMVNASSLTAISFPEFFVAYVLMLIFSVNLGILPTLANVSPDMAFGDRVFRCLLPSMTLSLVIIAHMMRMTRASIIALLASPYIEMARLKGASRGRTILRHALPNAWAPIVNIIAFNLAYLIVGVVVVEAVFVYPGIGQLMVDSVSTRDIPVVQGCALIFAGTYILLNLLADVVAIVTNPRILHPR